MVETILIVIALLMLFGLVPVPIINSSVLATILIIGLVLMLVRRFPPPRF